jgi:hypothetical protein
MNNDWELIAQRKLFDATGLRVGDTVTDSLTGETGTMYLSGIGYACVMLSSGRRVMWGNHFVKV